MLGPFARLISRDGRAHGGHKVSSASPKSHTPQGQLILVSGLGKALGLLAP